MSIEDFTHQMNHLGKERIPFLFFVDFEMNHPVILRLTDIHDDQLLYFVNGKTNIKDLTVNDHVSITKYPCTEIEYAEKFEKVLYHLARGDSYLTNLTVKTAVDVNLSLKDIFLLSHANYKMYYRDQFIFFSPEIFVKIHEGKINSFPMKGTIDADLPDAHSRILTDKKELAEHVTIVDLIRNDLSLVAENVTVKRFRYIDTIRTSGKTLLQVSSEIEGELPVDYMSRLGNIFVTLLPAGSVSGAPKPKTLEIIRIAESEQRGYYTGVMGIFDGETLDSGVMIRFIERQNNQLFYRSGGGITTQSIAQAEYQEVIDKVYVPVN